MRKPVRGFSERLIRFVGSLSVLLSALFALPRCVSQGELTLPGDPKPVDAPLGCRVTMCDYLFTSCADPCTECWNICKRQDDENSVIRCAGVCQQICAPTNKPTPLAQCEEELAICRSTQRNGVCVDTLTDDMPDGQPPCSAAMGAANCACGTDVACLGALDRLNTACRKCNAAWLMPCLDAACAKERDDVLGCMSARACGVLNECDGCEGVVSVLLTCFQKAQTNPADIGGCYSKPRACSSEPLCPYALY